MGLLARLAIFVPRGRQARDVAVEDAPAPSRDAAEAPLVETRPVGAGRERRAVAVRDPAAALRSARNRQELFDELQKNYREVVELVRKVDAHLDREQERAERLMTIAERFDQLMPRVAAIPESINNQAAELHHELIEAIRATVANDHQHTDRLENALDRIAGHVAEGPSSQVELVHTMAAFREVMQGVAEESARASRLLHETHTGTSRRETEMLELMQASRRTTVAAIILAVAVAVGAMGVAVAAIVMGMK